jgi:hypothetical protein
MQVLESFTFVGLLSTDMASNQPFRRDASEACDDIDIFIMNFRCGYKMIRGLTIVEIVSALLNFHTVLLQFQCFRSDGPLKDVMFSSGAFKIEFAKIFIAKARDLIHLERGCLALIVDPSEISCCTQILRTFFRMYHNIVVGTMSPAKTEDGEIDKRYQGFFEVIICFQQT